MIPKRCNVMYNHTITFLVNSPFDTFPLLFCTRWYLILEEPLKILSFPQKKKQVIHYVKSVQIRSFSGLYFLTEYYIKTEYGHLRNKFQYSVWIPENTEQKNLRIWTLFTQWHFCLLADRCCMFVLLSLLFPNWAIGCSA